jgi:hypothetical protein
MSDTRMTAQEWLSWLTDIGAPDETALRAARQEMAGAARRAS